MLHMMPTEHSAGMVKGLQFPPWLSMGMATPQAPSVQFRTPELSPTDRPTATNRTCENRQINGPMVRLYLPKKMAMPMGIAWAKSSSAA